MEKSKASWQLRNALKCRTRKWRRRRVVGFYFFLFFSVLCQSGRNHDRFGSVWWAAYPLLIAATLGQSWRRSQQRIVNGLDDRAQVEHGMNFDELNQAQQHEILSRRNLLFRIRLDSAPDERQQAHRLHANEAAFGFLRPALLLFAAAFWAVYLWMPAGDWRDMLTDSPVLISALVAFVITLPDAIEMWTEPDDPGEARVIGNATQAQAR